MRKLWAVLLLVALLWPTAATAQGWPDDTREVKSFVDSVVLPALAEQHIPAAVVAVVKDGRVVVSKGYGFANVEQQVVATADTPFQVGSVSKLFVATAIMQLVEQGKVGLDDDVNKHLKSFQIESAFGQPVTIRHLLTHTGGFEDKGIGIAAHTVADRNSLGDYLAHAMPRRVRPPGEVYSYSNHGYALLGHVVEVVSGQSFSDYVTHNITQPLRMTNATFEQSAAIASRVAVPYRFNSGQYQAVAFDYFNFAPAGSLSMSSNDAARFMLAQLQDGRLENTSILQPATAQEMHRQHFSHHPAMPGSAVGFYERFNNGQRAIAHDGGWNGVNANLYLVPGQNLGIFIAVNKSDTDLIYGLPKQILDRYYPYQPAIMPAVSGGDLSRYAGVYRLTRRTHTTLEKLNLINVDQFTVEIGGERLKMLNSEYAAVGPELFQEVQARSQLAFRKDSSGNVTYAFYQQLAYERVAWYDDLTTHLLALGLFVLTFIAGLTGWGIAALRRRRNDTSNIQPAEVARWLVVAVCALNLIFLVGLAASLLSLDQYEFTYGLPPLIVALLVLPLISGLLTLGVLVYALRAWRGGWWSQGGRLFYSVVALAALLFIPYLGYWNLLGFNY